MVDPYGFIPFTLFCPFPLHFTGILFSSNFYVYGLKKAGDEKITHVAKVFPLAYWVNRSHVSHEGTFFRECSKEGLAPPYLGTMFVTIEGKTYGLIISEYYGEGTLKQLWQSNLKEKEKDQIIKRLRELFEALAQKGIDHGDVHGENLLFTRKGEDYEFRLVDFESSSWKKEKSHIYPEIEISTGEILVL